MNEELFNRNLNALRRHPNVFSVVAAAARTWRQESYSVETAKNGQPTLGFSDENKRLISYHSRYDPVKEAE
ncbi:MAG TPA: hypothetical protein PKC25_10345, partial [Candidatus Rifleibacterium sp.]|nr:hypothetical protein [Candidatus Rifleibacterium sp.]